MRKQGFAAVTVPGDLMFVQHVHCGSTYQTRFPHGYYFLGHLMTPQLQRLRQKDDHEWLHKDFEAGCRGLFQRISRVWVLRFAVFWGTTLHRWVSCSRRFEGTCHLHGPWDLENESDTVLGNVGNRLPTNAAPHLRIPVPSTWKCSTGVNDERKKNSGRPSIEA